MKLQKSLILIVTISLFAIFFAGCTSENDNGTKDGALKFSLKIIKTYLDNDLNTFIGYCTDPFYTLENDGPFALKDVEDRLSGKNPFPNGKYYTNHTIDDFKSIYDIKTTDHSEYIKNNEYLKTLKIGDWSPNDDDYLFEAVEKDGKTGYIDNDLLTFMVTFQSGNWQLIALYS
jgi:hypothetical protein